MRWYCLVILFAVASLSAWAYPADGDLEQADESNLLALNNGEDAKDETAEESRILMDSEDEDEDEDYEEGLEGDSGEVSVAGDPLSASDRQLGRRPSKKPMKGKGDASSEEDKKSKDDASSEEDKKGGKKAPKKKCVCYIKKNKRHQKRRPYSNKSGRGDDEQST